MYTEARKIQLIEEVIKLEDEATLLKMEKLIRSGKPEKSKPSIFDFVGILSKKEAADIRQAIEESCETIHSDEWK